jgi:4-hydroxy-tetrahydrodipicolinate reductase
LSAPVRVAVAGAAGRLGGAIVEALAGSSGLELQAALVRPGSAREGTAVPGASDARRYTTGLPNQPTPQVLIDASLPQATAGWAQAAADGGFALLVAVTGLSPETQAALDRASKETPVLVAPNLSLGAVVLARLTREAAKRLPGYHLEIVETHHAGKRDSPSGTALWLARAAAEARGVDLQQVLQTGEARVGPRSEEQIAIHSVRSGSTPGEHRVRFGGAGEFLELAHVVESRAAFAMGALRASEWLASAPAGRYNMEDILTDC